MRKILLPVLIYAVLAVVVDAVAGSWVLPRNHRQYFTDTMARELQDRIRIDHPYFHHAFVPYASEEYTWSNTYWIHTNSLGFLDRTVRDVAPTTQKYRIVFIGDSFVEGLGYPFDDTFVGLINARLDPDRYEVLNAGMMSYAPQMYYNKIRYLLEHEKVSFDELVVFIDPSDPYDEMFYYKGFQPQDDMPNYVKPIRVRSYADYLRGFVSDHSLTVNTLAPFGKFVDERNIEPYASHRGDWTFNPQYYDYYGREGLALCETYMDKLLDLLKTHGITRVSVAVYPYPDQIRANDGNSIQQRYWRDYAQRRGIGFIDLFSAFFGRQQPLSLFIPGDVHWNREGHQLVADTVFPLLYAASASALPADPADGNVPQQ